jgi:hypothetical protein
MLNSSRSAFWALGLLLTAALSSEARANDLPLHLQPLSQIKTGLGIQFENLTPAGVRELPVVGGVFYFAFGKALGYDEFSTLHWGSPVGYYRRTRQQGFVSWQLEPGQTRLPEVLRVRMTQAKYAKSCSEKRPDKCFDWVDIQFKNMESGVAFPVRVDSGDEAIGEDAYTLSRFAGHLYAPHSPLIGGKYRILGY